ncbi:hypothetical protein TELCIR_07319 [Teladorsagia circumcincta]|uniref:Uncharacterized protein n=1 Tax=Teladorsagia circumcincta TaxID=45464 RepID=A0A2G9UKL5_TELCI|nr:hypothetical protein TELCIR_07319 [Teladorsagia circumcincta]
MEANISSSNVMLDQLSILNSTLARYCTRRVHNLTSNWHDSFVRCLFVVCSVSCLHFPSENFHTLLCFVQKCVCENVANDPASD